MQRQKNKILVVYEKKEETSTSYWIKAVKKYFLQIFSLYCLYLAKDVVLFFSFPLCLNDNGSISYLKIEGQR